MDSKVLEAWEKYDALAKEHGAGTMRGLGWSSKEVQEVRFSKLLEAIPDYDKANVLDVGCGAGDIVNMYGFHRKVSKYTGIDFLPENVKAARTRYSDAANVEFFVADIMSKEDMVGGWYDWVLASGLMSYYKPYQISLAVTHMWELCERGVLFNVMIPRTLPSFGDLLTIMQVAGIQRWTIRHDYLTEDVTVYGYKD